MKKKRKTDRWMLHSMSNYIQRETITWRNKENLFSRVYDASSLVYLYTVKNRFY